MKFSPLPVAKFYTSGSPNATKWECRTMRRFIAVLAVRRKLSLILLSVNVFFAVSSTGPVTIQAQTPAGAANAQVQAGDKPIPAPKGPAVKPKKPATQSPGSTNVPASYFAKTCSINGDNAEDIAKLIGNPKPFTVKVRDSRTLIIYKPTRTLNSSDQQELDGLCADIDNLATPPATSEEIFVPHSQALGDIAAKAKALNYPGITVQPAGEDHLRISRASSVTDNEYREFRADVLTLGSRLVSSAPVTRLYYVGAADAAKVLQPSKSDKSSGGQGPTAPGTVTTVTVDSSATQNVNSPTCPTTKTSSPDATDSGAAASQDNAASNHCTAADSTSTKNPKDGGSATSTASLSISTLSPDLLVFGNDHPGDDAEIAEKKRVLAAVDFPRPEVIINTFSFQTSASQSKVLIDGNQRLQAAVGRYNDGIQKALDRTWAYLQKRADDNRPLGAAGKFFDREFVNYLTQKFVADETQSDAIGESTSVDSGKTPKSIRLADRESRSDICARDRYCLGYSSLFNPIRPSLTDMLLAVISSQDPAKEIIDALNVMENKEQINSIEGRDLANELRRCNYQCLKMPENVPLACDQRDVFVLRKVNILAERARLEKGRFSSDILPLFCFREEIGSAFPQDTGAKNRARLLRAALADFLFQYKWSQEYPHDFSPFQLTQSAQTLNSELNPLIVAFNRDLAAALQPLEDIADLNGCSLGKCGSGRNGLWFWEGHDTRFVNNGIITVRTVSGKETTVDAVTQNFFDSTEPPAINDLINSVGQAQSNIPGVLKTNLTANEAAVIIGALNSVKPAVSQIGREFKIDITPHSLSGASAAELDLQMTTGDQADPKRYSNGKSESDNLSRVAKQTVNTKVRLESIKLFEISSFSATLERSRSNVPIIPPLFEIPYVGSILSFPVSGGKEFHRSTAVMSAVVVPTAADLANGLKFTHDSVLESMKAASQNVPKWCTDSRGNQVTCRVRSTYSWDSITGPLIWESHHQMVRCFALNETPCERADFKKLF